MGWRAVAFANYPQQVYAFRMAIKTLFLLEDTDFGGTQKQNLELAARLNKNRFAAQVLSLTGPGALESIAAGIPVRHLTSGSKARPFFFARLPFILADIKPDILIPCTALPNIWGRIWGKLLEIPVILGTVRGGGAPMRQHERFLWRMATHLVCNSQPLIAEMRKRGAPADKLTYIANGLDTEQFRPAQKPPAEPVILCVARLCKDKDHPTLIRAFAKARQQIPTARLRIVGDGPGQADLVNFARQNLTPEQLQAVEFAGASTTPWQEYPKASVFALASMREGQPNVIMEAMSCGLPVCSTNVGGIPALVGENGLLSAPGDANALAANLVRALSDANLAAKLGQAGRTCISENFSFAAMVSRYENLLERLWRERTKQ